MRTPNSSAETCAGLERRQKTKSAYINLYLIIPIVCLWPVRDWSKPPAVSLLRHMRGLRLFTLYYCTIVAVSAIDGRSNTQYILAIYNTDYRAIAKFTRRRRVARSDNYSAGHEPGTRSLQWNVIRCAAGLLSTAVFYSQRASCSSRRRDAEVRKTFAFL